MSEETLMTYALWGTGNITPENAKALLNEYIPDNVGTVYRPERITRDMSGLRTALDWFEVPEFLGAGGAVPSTDLIQSLIDERDGEFHDEVYLLALWPEKPSHEDFDFIESAQAQGITVFDLSRALDELDLSLYSRPEPTKEEKAEAKAAVAAEKRGRGQSRKKPSDDGQVSEDARQEVAAEIYQKPELVSVSAPVPPPGEEESTAMFKMADASMNLLEVLDRYVEAKVNAYLAQKGITINVDLDTVEQDRTPFEGPYVGKDTKPYFKSPDGSYRPATGKPRRGEIVENLTDAQAAEREIPPF